MKVQIADSPYQDRDAGKLPWEGRGHWPCQWIACPGAGEPPFVAAYRCRFAMERATTVRVHVAADERYELFLDGERAGRGNERGDPENWFFDTYDFRLATGPHVFVARVWSLGDAAPIAQMSVAPGFLFSPETDEFVALLGTGVAEWTVKKLAGYEFDAANPNWAMGASLVLDAARMPRDIESGGGEGWVPADALRYAESARHRVEFWPGHGLTPSTLPAMLERPLRIGRARHVSAVDAAAAGTFNPVPDAIDAAQNLVSEAEAWNRLLLGDGPMHIPPRTSRRVVIDLEDYYCAYPQPRVSGGRGSLLRIQWAENLYEGLAGPGKGNRDEIEGKFFRGVGDIFKPDGSRSRTFHTLWWRCGRYLEVLVKTGEEALEIEELGLRETRYPLEMESSFAASDPRLASVVRVSLRALQMCAHETYLDCPYHEQLMYVGDTRLEALMTYVLTRNDRLPRKALQLFATSRLPSGLTRSRHPCRRTQIIPPFSLWWVAMVHDYAYWRDDLAFVRSLLPAVRTVIDHFAGCLTPEGLLAAPIGWNFADWVPAWKIGVPPDGDGVSGLLNWHFILVLGLAADLESICGEPELAARARRLADGLAKSASAAFWSEERGLFADDLGKTSFSEHTQCLAILSGCLKAETRARVARNLVSDPSLARTTIYFTHYLFEAYRVTGQIDALFERLALWFELEKLGFKTTFEAPEPSRSDCHAWGAHPLFHCFATILGIRPASAGFRTVEINPQLGALTMARGRLIHPAGEIEAECWLEAGALLGNIRLPGGVTAPGLEPNNGLRIQTGP